MAKSKREGGGERPSPLPIIFALVIAGLLIVSGYIINKKLYGGGGDDTSSIDYVNAGDEKSGNSAPSFVLISTEGKRIDSRDLKGRVVLLDLMATWCGPCSYQVEELKDIRSSYSESDLVIISVDVDPKESASQLRDYKEEKGATWDFCTSTEGFRENYPAEAVPTLYILDRNFEIYQVFQGVKSSEELSNTLDEVI